MKYYIFLSLIKKTIIRPPHCACMHRFSVKLLGFKSGCEIMNKGCRLFLCIPQLIHQCGINEMVPYK